MAKKEKLFHIKINLQHKMPVSLNTLDLGIGEASLGNGTSTTKRRLKTTNKMVEDALIQLHAAKGIYLFYINNEILKH